MAALPETGFLVVADRAIDGLRLEKGYGIWSAEFRQDVTPGMSGLDRFVAWDKGDFIGRVAALGERDAGPARRLVLLAVEAADASRDDGIWLDGRLVGLATSGAYGHHVGLSLALAYLDVDVIAARPELTVFVVGEPRPARVLPEIPYDPRGERLRDGMPWAIRRWSVRSPRLAPRLGAPAAVPVGMAPPQQLDRGKARCPMPARQDEVVTRAMNAVDVDAAGRGTGQPSIAGLELHAHP